jgi:hypothetical protein
MPLYTMATLLSVQMGYTAVWHRRCNASATLILQELIFWVEIKVGGYLSIPLV